MWAAFRCVVTEKPGSHRTQAAAHSQRTSSTSRRWVTRVLCVAPLCGGPCHCADIAALALAKVGRCMERRCASEGASLVPSSGRNAASGGECLRGQLGGRVRRSGLDVAVLQLWHLRGREAAPRGGRHDSFAKAQAAPPRRPPWRVLVCLCVLGLWFGGERHTSAPAIWPVSIGEGQQWLFGGQLRQYLALRDRN